MKNNDLVFYMETLVVNCYKDAEKIVKYLTFIKDFTNYKLMEDLEVTPDMDVSSFDAILISGSTKNISQGQFQKCLLEFIKQTDLPVIGICYGFQILSYVFGCQVKRLDNLIEGDTTIKIVQKDVLFDGLPEEITVRETHQDYVDCQDENLVDGLLNLLAKSESNSICVAEAIKHKEKPIYGVQFHIEQSGDVGRKIIENFYTKVVKK